MVTWYVSPSGNDATGEGSEEFPFLTINKAHQEASSGDIIDVAAGTYTNSLNTISKNITIRGPNAGISGNSSRNDEAIILNLQMTISSSTIIDGLKFYHTNNSINEAINLQSATTIQNCIFERSASESGSSIRAIFANNIDNYVIKYNLFTGSTLGNLFGSHLTWNSALFLNGKTNGIDSYIKDNVFENCRTAINADNNTESISLLNNTFSNCGTYIAFGGQIATASVMNNISGNIFNIDNLPSALINNSNVQDSVRVDITNNKFRFLINDSLIDLQPSELSLVQKFNIESKLFHKGRSSRNGIIYFSPNQQFVLGITGFSSISKSYGYAQNEEEIIINSGTYTENLTLDKSISLIGVDRDSCIIQSSPTQTVATIQIKDISSNNPSGSTLKNLSVKGRVITQTVSGSGDASNNNSSILILGNTINNLTFDNCKISNASNGIAFNNLASENILIKNCIIENNDGVGIIVASTTAQLDGLTIDGCTIQNNNLSAISTNPLGFYLPNQTNFNILNSNISDNNKLTVNNSHDVSIFGFNGNLTIRDTNIKSNHVSFKAVNNSSQTTGGYALVIFGRKEDNGEFYPSGEITLSNVRLDGSVTKHGFGLDRYNTVNNINLNGLDLENLIPNGAEQTWTSIAIGHKDVDNNLNLNDTKLKSISVSNIGHVNAKSAVFFHKNTGVLLDKSRFNNLFQIENQIFHAFDDIPNVGFVYFNDNDTVIVIPSKPNSIINAIESITKNSRIILDTGRYTVNSSKIISKYGVLLTSVGRVDIIAK